LHDRLPDRVEDYDRFAGMVTGVQAPELVDPMERLAALPRRFAAGGGVNQTIDVSATFAVTSANDMKDLFSEKLGPEQGQYVYGRSYAPTTRHFAEQLAAIEGTEAAHATASGLSAIVGALLNVCNSGDHIVASDTLYGGTFTLLKEFFPNKMNITTTFVHLDDTDAVAAAIRPNTRVVYAETLSNPTLRVADIPALAEIAHAKDLPLFVDNTFAPLLVSPALWGADVVLTSLTKYFGGGADVIAGAVCASRAFIDKLMNDAHGTLMMLGPVMDQGVASDLGRRLPHLGVRVAEHSRRALALAERLQKEGIAVEYPGLEVHPHSARLAKLCNPGGYGSSGMVTVDLGSYERAAAFMEAAHATGFGIMAVSLGCAPATMITSRALGYPRPTSLQ